MVSGSTDLPRVVDRDEGSTAVLAAHVLSLAAAPTFAIMAALTFRGSGAHEFWCCTRSHWPLPTGMSLMYLLMGVFHAPAWLKLGSIQRARARTAARPQPDGGDRDISRIDTGP